MNFSADKTSHHSINYNSHHVNLKAELYDLRNESNEKHQVTHLFGIQSSPYASSKEAIKDWDKSLSTVIDIFNHSPFGK